MRLTALQVTRMLLVTGLLGLAAVACGSDDRVAAPGEEIPTSIATPISTPRPTYIPPVTLDPKITNWGTWWTVDGEAVSEQIIKSIMGPEHCSWDTVTFLYTGDPIGENMVKGSSQTFTRDPYGDLNRGGRQLVQFDDDAELPSDAEFSGYSNDGAELWISPTRIEFEVFMVGNESVEKWPRMNPSVGCA